MLDKFVIEKFIPYFEEERKKHIKTKFATPKGFLDRLGGCRLFYENHRFDWVVLLKKSEDYFLENYLNENKLNTADWAKSIATVKNANEELNQRSAFITNYRMLILTLAACLTGIGIIGGTVALFESIQLGLTSFIVLFTFGGSVVGLISLVEKHKNQNISSLYVQAINICDFLSKKYPEQIAENIHLKSA